MKNFEKHYKRVYIMLALFIYAVIPVVLFLLITSRTSVFFGIRSFDVLTGSMKPMIPVGAMVFTQPQRNYHIGDIITFNRGQITITHRIVDEKNNAFQTKGDANKIPDPQLVTQTSIVGKIIFILPFLGRFTGLIKTVPGFILFILIPTLLFIAYEIRNIKKEWEKEIEKKLVKKMKKLEQSAQHVLENI